MTTIELSVRFRICFEGMPYPMLVKHMKRLLLNCNVNLKDDLLQLTPSFQAAYEHQIVELRGIITVDIQDTVDSVAGQEAVARLATEFCANSFYSLHEQPYMNIVSMNRHFCTIRTSHENVPIPFFAMGNMPNFGLFFTRSSYIPMQNNAYGNRGVADCNLLTSFASFEHDRRIFRINFAIRYDTPAGFKGYKMEIPYAAIHSLIVDCGLENDKHRFMFIRLRYPPQLWEAIPYKVVGRDRNAGTNEILNMARCKNWLRARQWPSNDQHSTGCSSTILGNSPILCLGFFKTRHMPLRMSDSGQISPSDLYQPTVELFEIIGRLKERTRVRVDFASIRRINLDYSSRKPPSDLGTFHANYCLEALLSRGSVFTDQLPPDPIFYRRIRWCIKENSTATEEALEELLAAVDEKRIISLLNAFEYFYSNRLAEHRRAISGEKVHTFGPDLPDNCILIRKVTVLTIIIFDIPLPYPQFSVMLTPMRTLLMSSEVMMTNRVIRRFGQEFALRCIFRDDNAGKLIANEMYRGHAQEDRSTIIDELIRETMEHGISIADRRYHFLAWSNSQMRDHGCYMYSTGTLMDARSGMTNQIDVEHIRHWMGDFTASKSVPKLMSRMGQCFTQALPTIKLHRSNWLLDADVIGGKINPATGEQYTFSDGVGRISVKFAARIAEKLQLTPVPSCFQMRFKGFKGVLCVDPHLDADGKEDLVFRKSQKKFDDPDDTSQVLEIVKYAMPSPTFLNKPLIMILDQVSKKHGSRTHTKVVNRVHQLLEDELNTMAGMLCSEEKSAEALHNRLPISMDFHQLRDNGFQLTNEPFFRSLLLAIHRYNIRQQLHKTKIPIPIELGRTMFGVLDETGMLQYGQVFLQISLGIRKATPIEHVRRIIGPVLITKNPCLQPGDVRLFEAVFYDGLAHLRDVVVFPRYGDRPHPDEMAGSDLDGDEYSVFFDKELMFDRNERAMHFPKLIARNIYGSPTTEDMVDFFLKYLNQNSIGRMSNAHLMAADRLPDGIFDPICESIACKCSIAVDFPKTGLPADRLTRDEMTDRSPDFMQKDHKPAYRSRRLVGQLYRKVKKVENILDVGQFSILDDCFDPDLYDSQQFTTRTMDKKQACTIRDQYNSKIQHLLDEYGISDEASLVSGHMVTIKSRISEQEKEDFSFYNTDKIIELRYGRIYESFRNEFFNEFGGEKEFVTTDVSGRRTIRSNDALLLKAKAWYMVSYGPEADGNTARFRSFPWLVWDLLAVIKRRATFAKSSYVPSDRLNPLVSSLSSAIDQHCCRNSAHFSSFLADLSTLFPSSLDRYRRRYLHLDQLLFIIDFWAHKDHLFQSGPLRRQHLAILLVQFGLGRLESAIDQNCKRVFYLSEVVDEMPVENEHPIDLSLMKGHFLLEFIKFLASQSFLTLKTLDFRTPNMTSPNDPPMILTNRHSRIPLVMVAFKTYHHIALTGRFAALHMETKDDDLFNGRDRSLPWDYGEMDVPIVIELPNFGSAMSDNNLAINDSIVCTRLKDWSQVHEVRLRRANPFKHEQILVSAAGTLRSRQTLQRILLTDSEQLRDHLISGDEPEAVKDEFL